VGVLRTGNQQRVGSASKTPQGGRGLRWARAIQIRLEVRKVSESFKYKDLDAL
jgi:hypothetical protein